MRAKMGKGFTLVELIIVITVIAILATITMLAMGHFESQGRDGKRLANATSIASALEKYYDQNGEYPSCASLTANAATVTGVSGPLAGLDQSALVAPQASTGTTNSISCSDLTSGTTDYFAYVGDGSAECQTTSCLQFTLKYWDEESQSVKTIESKRKADVNTSGNLAISTGPVTYTAATLNWNALSNATSYVLQRDSQSNFGSGSVTQQTIPAGTTTYQFNDMAPNTKRFYRVKAVSATGDSLWSNTVSQTTNTLPVPTLTTTQTNPSQITQSWSASSGVTSYTIQRSTTNTFPTGANTDETTGTATSQTYTDTPVATARYYRVRTNVADGNNTLYNGSWSSPISYTTVVPAPNSAPSVTASISGTSAIGKSGTVTCSQGATPYYQIRETHKANSGYGDSWTAWSSWTSTAPTMTVAALQGNRHMFQAQAACVYSGVYGASSAGGTASAVRGINQPGSPTWPNGLSRTWKSNTYGHYMNFNTFCPDGTWPNQTWFHSKAWAGSNGGDFYHTFGFNDYWILGPSGGANVEYWAQYTCISSFASESAWSNLSYDVIWVTP